MWNKFSLFGRKRPNSNKLCIYQILSGSAASGREDKKVEKYSNLSENYHFVPIGIETFGAYGPQAKKLIK